MVGSYGTRNFNEHTAQFRFDRLKPDQALPIYVVQLFGWLKRHG